VREAEQLARDEDFDSIGLIVEHYGQLRAMQPLSWKLLNSERRQPLKKLLRALKSFGN
jgi:hypothetical protein